MLTSHDEGDISIFKSPAIIFFVTNLIKKFKPNLQERIITVSTF